MKLPRSIWIGGKRFTIVKRKHLDELGKVDWDKKKILLLYPHPDIKDTLLHECLHLIEMHFEMAFREEDIIRITTGLRMMFIDNPWMIELLKEG